MKIQNIIYNYFNITPLLEKIETNSKRDFIKSGIIKSLKLLNTQWAFFILLFVITLIYISHTNYPPVFQDEVQINEFGRTFLDNQTNWGINLDKNLHPVATTSYLGCSIQELIFLKFHSFKAMRLFTILFMGLASVFLYLYLFKKYNNRLIALLCSICLFVDRVIIAHITQGRLESYVFFLIFFSLYIFHYKVFNVIKPYLSAIYIALVCSLTLYLWFTSFIVWPILIFEWYDSYKNKLKLKDIFFSLLAFVISFIVLTVIIGLPIFNVKVFRQLVSGISNDTEVSTLQMNISGLFAWIKQDFILFILFLISCLNKKNRPITYTTIFLILLFLLTRFYSGRIIYLYPYFFISISILYLDFKIKTNFYKLSIYLLTSLLIITSLYNSILKPQIIFWTIKKSNNYDYIVNSLKGAIGIGPQKVYIGSYKTYYAGRELGWKLYKYASIGNDFNNIDTSDFILNHVDYAVIALPIDSIKLASFVQKGFFQIQKIIIPGSNRNDFLWRKTDLYRHRYENLIVLKKIRQTQTP